MVFVVVGDWVVDEVDVCEVLVDGVVDVLVVEVDEEVVVDVVAVVVEGVEVV